MFVCIFPKAEVGDGVETRKFGSSSKKSINPPSKTHELVTAKSDGGRCSSLAIISVIIVTASVGIQTTV